MGKKYEIEDIKAAVEEMIEVMGLQEGGEPLQAEEDEEKLLQQLNECIEQIQKGDKFSKETLAVITWAKNRTEIEKDPPVFRKPAPVEKAKPKEEEEKDSPAKRLPPVRHSELVPFLTKEIEKGKVTRKDLIVQAMNKFGVSKSTVTTLISDGKNQKYCKFKQLVLEDENGILSFQK